jgi:peptidoglycan glycosyltransferase
MEPSPSPGAFATVVWQTHAVAYPSRPAGNGVRAGNGSDVDGNGTPRPSLAARLASTRSGRKSGRAGSILPVVFVGLVLVAVVAVATSVLAIGGATGALLAQLEQDLPDVQQFETMEFPEPTVIYARDGKRVLGTFLEERRRVVTFKDVPTMVLDATTAIEDRSFWSNEGYDLESTLSALVSDVTNATDRGGGSTITQQFVRARLLPRELLAPGSDVYLRKAKEIIQAYRLTQAFPGEAGKRRIITAYLNQIYYGHNAYGIAAAAGIYFGKNLNQLTLAETAMLAGLPQSPSTLDPHRYAKRDRRGRLVIKPCQQPPPECIDSPTVARRNYALDSLAQGFGRWNRPTAEEIEAAKKADIVLAPERPILFKAAHFVWAVRGQLDGLLADREPVERGGYKVITTLDWRAQTVAEKYIEAATIAPNLNYRNYLRKLRSLRIRGTPGWIDFLRGKGIHNGALVALDYKTGDILAYVGSANYYARDRGGRLDPKFDVAGVGYRQPGSAWKPILYATGIEEKALTAGSLLMDVTTSFASSWDPKDADEAERGPVLVRKALQYSLNIPAIRALDRIGTSTMRESTKRAGITFLNGGRMMTQAGLAGAIGTVETRVLELTAAFGSFGNGGVVNEPRYIKRIFDADGQKIYDAGEPVKRPRFVSPQTAFIISDILAGNTNPSENSVWGPEFALFNGPGGSYRTAAVKTGTTNEIEDLSTYGFLPAPRGRAPGIALGVWMGNSNHAPATVDDEDVFAMDGPGKVWRAFMQDYMRGKPAPDFNPPGNGLVRATIDAYTGGRPGPWTRSTTSEWFLAGTQPGARGEIDKAGLLYTQRCGTWMVDPVKGEPERNWRPFVRDWARRAQRGQGVASRIFGTVTLHLYDRNSFGGPVTAGGPCPTPKPTPTPVVVSPAPREDPQPEPTRRPRATPQPPRRPRATPAPTPRPTCRPNGRPGRPPGCQP